MAGFIDGILVAIGLFIVAVAWFVLRNGELWALATVSGTGLLMIPFWYPSFRPYLETGISLTLADLPPIFWIPTVVVVPATLLGITGLRPGKAT